jgi:hypothetical protein
MTDIVERLLDTSKFETWEDLTGLIVEAADEIERLRAALKAIKAFTDTGEPDWNDAIGEHARRALGDRE